MNRLAWLIAVGYLGLALVSAGIYAAATAKFVDYSQTALVFSPGYLRNATFTRTPAGWSIALLWRFENPGRLPFTIASFQFEFAVDNTSDSRLWTDPAKLASEYTLLLAFYEDRFTGPVIAPGATWERPWRFNVTDPADVAKIAPSSADGKFYLGVLDGQIVFYISDVGNRWVAPLPPSYTGL